MQSSSLVKAIQLPVKKGKSVTGKYYKDVELKKLKKYYQLAPCWHPIIGFKHVQLLHNKFPAHTSAIVANFLQKEVLPHPPYSLDLAPCDSFLFPKLKTILAGWRYRSRQDWRLYLPYAGTLPGYPKSAYCETFRKWIHRLKICISSHGDYFEGMKSRNL